MWVTSRLSSNAAITSEVKFVPWSEISSSGKPNMQKTWFCNASATVFADVSFSGTANGKITVKMYLKPCFVRGSGPTMSMAILLNG